jgi:Transglutaminase-like superfamily
VSALDDDARHSPYTDPGPYAPLLDALPTDISDLAAVVRNVVVHYRAAGITFHGERLAEIDLRWVERILATDQRRFAAPLSAHRPLADRVTGCCRDFTLLTVAALRHRGVPARSRVGFADYFGPRFHYDHVIAEFWNGRRWVFADAQLGPRRKDRFDSLDMPLQVGATATSTPHFATTAQVWTAFRRGAIDVDRYGVDPRLPYRGAGFVRNYVLYELAHRQRDELLLWDQWGAMGGDLRDSELGGGDLSREIRLIDDVAALLLAADDGSAAAEQELAERYAADPGLHPGDRVRCVSPSGADLQVDLRTRELTPTS